jgi:hypothetical protein
LGPRLECGLGSGSGLGSSPLECGLGPRLGSSASPFICRLGSPLGLGSPLECRVGWGWLLALGVLMPVRSS